jgi:hypothetical protein
LYRIELWRNRWASVTKPAIFIGIEFKQVFIRLELSSINYRTLKPDSPDSPQSYSAANNWKNRRTNGSMRQRLYVEET